MKPTLLASMIAILLPACGAHLGADHGKASRAAFSAQTERTSLRPGGLDAQDANLVRMRRGDPDSSAAEPQATTPQR